MNDGEFINYSFLNLPELINHMISAGPNYFVSARSDGVGE